MIRPEIEIDEVLDIVTTSVTSTTDGGGGFDTPDETFPED